MSRTKNKVTKELKGLSLEEKLARCEYGDGHHNEHVVAALATIHHAAALERGHYGKLTAKMQKGADKWKQAAWRLVCDIILSAYDKSDGSFLRTMAYAIEHQPSKGKSVDPERAFIAAQFGGAEAFDLPHPTVPQLMRETGKDRRSITRMLSELELKPGKAKRGGARKRGSK